MDTNLKSEAKTNILSSNQQMVSLVAKIILASDTAA